MPNIKALTLVASEETQYTDYPDNQAGLTPDGKG
jgi:hypothetical protein